MRWSKRVVDIGVERLDIVALDFPRHFLIVGGKQDDPSESLLYHRLLVEPVSLGVVDTPQAP